MSQEASQTSFNLRLVEEENLCWDQCPSANSSCDSSPAFETQKISHEMELSQVVCPKSKPMDLVDYLKGTYVGPNQQPQGCQDENIIDLNKDLLDTSMLDSKYEVETKKRTNMKRRIRKSLMSQSKNIGHTGKSHPFEGNTKPTFVIEGNAINSGEQSNSASHMKELSKVSIRSIWFSLIACDDKAELALPQIPKRYIHTKHGNLPVSYIGKYLATKLNLKHESEVEILCFGQPLLPNLSLQNLVEIWAQATANGEKALISTGEGTCDGSSFVMELTYRRSEEHV
ncbi:E3 ubiquitin protein ligase DRIP1-like [Malania oleifera]|uniref:E3 ubiquitin protein ligase DRIP1-like n=1 Tax=Malania oleifera TaxID=397392 RepID=UPI0025ADA892|nr:E3 ubiquitin protein ligase DRIP1-like [Malania oleifera]